jgi:transcriptional regulator with XRE-family HTH domain
VLEDEEFRAFLKALGARIRTIRKGKNFDMRHIMITSGYYDAQWRKYETGGSLNLQSLLKIALTLEVPLTELFDGLGQWPILNVEEIEKRRLAKQNLLKPEAESMQAFEAEQILSHELSIKAKSSQPVAKKSSVSRKTTTNAKTQFPQGNDVSLSGRKSAK